MDNLEYLNISKCKNVDCFKIGKMENLKYLDVSDCRKISWYQIFL